MKSSSEIATQLLVNIVSYLTLLYGELDVKDHPHLFDMTVKALESYAEERVKEIKEKKLEWAAGAIDKAHNEGKNEGLEEAAKIAEEFVNEPDSNILRLTRETIAAAIRTLKSKEKA